MFIPLKVQYLNVYFKPVDMTTNTNTQTFYKNRQFDKFKMLVNPCAFHREWRKKIFGRDELYSKGEYFLFILTRNLKIEIPPDYYFTKQTCFLDPSLN